MENENLITVKLWSPLFPMLYPELIGHYISAEEVINYQAEIQAAIDNEWGVDEKEHGLAVYIESDSLIEAIAKN